MSDASQPAAPFANPPQWNADAVFAALGDPVRRTLLLTIARGGPKPATVLKDFANRRLNATLKHLAALRAAGLLVTEPDRVDKRRMLYALSPALQVTKSDAGFAMDFGFCLLRL
jgi:DNA-binding transcriptional ArsR family regulator